jgi:thioredoxin reductase (NADPH)
VTIVGHQWDTACHDLRRFLARNQVTFDWVTPDDPELPARWPAPRPGEGDWPVLRLADGATLVRPQPREVAQRLGLQTRARSTEYDTIIIGAGAGWRRSAARPGPGRWW